MTETSRTKGKGKAKGKDTSDGLGITPAWTTVYKVSITTRAGQRTYVGLELREDTPEQVEIKAGLPTSLRAKWEKNYVPLERIQYYIDLMKGKLRHSIVLPGVQVNEAGDSASTEKPALPSTYTLNWRWTENATPPSVGGTEEGASLGGTTADTAAAKEGPAEEGVATEVKDVGITGGGIGAFVYAARGSKRARGEEWNDEDSLA